MNLYLSLRHYVQWFGQDKRSSHKINVLSLLAFSSFETLQQVGGHTWHATSLLLPTLQALHTYLAVYLALLLLPALHCKMACAGLYS